MTQKREPQPRVPTGFKIGSTPWKESLAFSALVCLILASAIIAVYWPVAHHDFVDYDDGDYVTGNATVQGGITWAHITWAFTTGHASNWHPLTWLSHMLDCQLFAQQAGMHHLVNLAFHVANTCLLFIVLRRMTAKTWRSVVVAAIFGLHPLHVESVAWISERKDVLSTFFLFLTLGAYNLYVRSKGTASPDIQPLPKKETRRGVESNHTASRASKESGQSHPWMYYLLSLIFFAFGLMSKPMLVTVPFVLLLLDYWPLRRASADGGKGSWGELLLEKVPFLILAASSSVVTFLVQREGGAVSVSLSLGQRLGNAAVSYARYLFKAFWPEHLSVLYPHPGSWPAWQVGGAVLLLLAITIVVLLAARKRPYLFVGWLLFVGTLVPVIGLVQVGIQSMADRYMYVPLIGLSIAVVWGVAECAPGTVVARRGLAATIAVVIPACCILTANQVGYWRDTETLFRRAVEVTKNNYLAYNNLGFYLSNHGRPLEAMEYYRKSIEINGSYEDALNNMGFVLAGQKRPAEALPYYEAALRLKPKHIEVNNNLGNALSELGRLPEAIQHYQIALGQKPDHADAHNNLGIALAMQGKVDQAIQHFRDAIRYKPNYASAHSNLGNALASKQQWGEAIAEYRECLRLNPGDAQAHNNLANVLTAQGKFPEAIMHYETALRLNSNNPEAHFNLGVALRQNGDLVKARSHFAEALRLKPDYLQAQRQIETLPPAPHP